MRGVSRSNPANVKNYVNKKHNVNNYPTNWLASGVNIRHNWSVEQISWIASSFALAMTGNFIALAMYSNAKPCLQHVETNKDNLKQLFPTKYAKQKARCAA